MSKQNVKKGNFLSRLIEEEKREFVRRDMHAYCDIAYLKMGIRGYNKVQAVILNISEGGAFVKLPILLERRQDIYLLLKNFPFKISGFIVNSSDKGSSIKFANPIPEKAVHHIASGRPYVNPQEHRMPNKQAQKR